MRKKIFNTSVETTDDCVAVLCLYKHSKWKRKSKFNIKIDADETQVVRTFTNGEETVSLISTDRETILCLIDLYPLKATIEEIQKYAKKVYTHDYGDVYLNPWEMKVWAVGGDGGIFYSEKLPSVITEEFEEEGFEGFDGDVDFNTITGIKETIIEAESSPDDADEDDGYIFVARAIDMGNLEF